jgi:hypothetical protein
MRLVFLSHSYPIPSVMVYGLLLMIPIIHGVKVIEHSVDLSKSRVVIVPLPAPPTSDDVIHHFAFILPPAPSDKMTQLTANINAAGDSMASVWDMYSLSDSVTTDIQCKALDPSSPKKDRPLSHRF